MWRAVTAAAGGVIAASRAARTDGVAGSLSSGLHHARYDRGRGFCSINGLALAARLALEEGAESVLILDLDAHCGGGTASLIAGRPRVWQLDVVRDSGDYLPTVAKRLAALASVAPRFDLCLYNACMDPHEDDESGGLAGVTTEMLAQREALVFGWCHRHKIPVAFVLAGGYTGAYLDPADLAALHRLTVQAAATHRPSPTAR